MKLSPWNWINLVLAAGLGLAVWITPALAADKLADADYKKLSAAPKTKQDHLTLAKHYRALLAEHQAEAKMYESLAAGYQKGVPGLTAAQARDLNRAARHVGEHARDFAEAVEHIAEAHEGYAENMK